MDATLQGEVVYLYAFDVANEIVTAPIKEVLGHPARPFEIRVDRTSPKDVPLYKPWAVDLPALSAHFRDQEVRLQIRIYEVGVICILFRMSFAVGNLHELLPFHNPVLENGRTLDQIASDVRGEAIPDLRPFLVHPTPPTVAEAYTAFVLTNLGSVQDANSWLKEQRRAVAGLLTETEPDRLSEVHVAEVLRLQRSFEASDLVVIDWDAALVVDLTGYYDDVLYVLELANLQLEEFRVLDQILDRYLDRAYLDVEKRHFTMFGLASVSERLRRLRVEVTKLADEVTHITKFFGDWHLARVYLAARERFYLDQWSGSVERRLGQLDHLYGVVQSEVNEKRTLWLEVIVVILILIELLTALFLHH